MARIPRQSPADSAWFDRQLRPALAGGRLQVGAPWPRAGEMQNSYLPRASRPPAHGHLARVLGMGVSGLPPLPGRDERGARTGALQPVARDTDGAINIARAVRTQNADFELGTEQLIFDFHDRHRKGPVTRVRPGAPDPVTTRGALDVQVDRKLSLSAVNYYLRTNAGKYPDAKDPGAVLEDFSLFGVQVGTPQKATLSLGSTRSPKYDDLAFTITKNAEVRNVWATSLDHHVREGDKLWLLLRRASRADALTADLARHGVLDGPSAEYWRFEPWVQPANRPGATPVALTSGPGFVGDALFVGTVFRTPHIARAGLGTQRACFGALYPDVDDGSHQAQFTHLQVIEVNFGL